MLQWLLYLLAVIIQNSSSAEIRWPADAAIPLSTETSTEASNTPGENNVASGELLATDALKASPPDTVNSHTITVSDFAKKTAAVNNERSAEQTVIGDGTNPSVGDLVRPTTQHLSPNLPQETQTGYLTNPVAQANPVAATEDVVILVSNSNQLPPSNSVNADSEGSSKVWAEHQLPSAMHENIQTNVSLLLQSGVQSQEAKGIPQNTFVETLQPSTLSQEQHGESSQATANINQPTSVSQSSAQDNSKMTVEEIIHPAAGSQSQQTSIISTDISPLNNPITISVHGGSSQVTASIIDPASVSQSSAQENSKMTVEEIIHPAAESQPQQTSNTSIEISPLNNPITIGLQNPTTLQAINSPQYIMESNLSESSKRNNLQQPPAFPINDENNVLPTSVVLPTASPIEPTITVEEVTSLTRTDQQPTSDLHKEPPQETTRPMNTASQQVSFGVGDDKETTAHIDSTPKENVETSVSSDSNSDNKQANAVKTEDKGGGISANIVEDVVSTMTPFHSLEEIHQYSLTDLSNKISYEIKQYRNDVSAAWELEKHISWTADATSYLKDYMDAISISKSAHNSPCVENDLKNYEIRSKSLQDIIESCRTGVKRDDWNALQDKTFNVLSSVGKVVQNASNIISMLNKESEIYEVVKSAIEDYAKNSICLIDTQSLRKSFSDLKELSIRTDKEEYQKCIDSKPEQSMIKDTMSDIMRIKNNCVG